jgi:hypothetical protein
MEDLNQQPFDKKFIRHMNKTEREYVKERVDMISDFLVQQYNGATERVIKSLFLINAGGVVTILTYLHNSSLAKCSKMLCAVALLFFIVGLVFSFMMVSLDYFSCYWRQNFFNKNVKNFFDDKVTLAEVPDLNGEHPSQKMVGWLMGFGIFSGAFSIFGIFFGLFGYFI